MDDKKPDENKLTDTVNNICTILGGALLLYPLIDHAAKNLLPELGKLASVDTQEGLRLLTSGQDKHNEHKPAERKPDQERERDDKPDRKHDDDHDQKPEREHERKREHADDDDC
jgi:hypothetical protein